MYSYLKCIVYHKLLKPQQSFRITLYLFQYKLFNALSYVSFVLDILLNTFHLL